MGNKLPYGDLLVRAIGRLKAMLLERVGFFSRGRYNVCYSQRGPLWDGDNGDMLNKWIVIVGREHYFESVRDYPIGHLGDVKNVLKNETWRYPHKGLLFLRIERLSEHSHRVTSWVIKEDILDNYSRRPIWVVPESACLANLASETFVGTERLGEVLYVSDAPDGLTSSLGQEVAFLNRVGACSTNSKSVKSDDLMWLSENDAVEAVLSGALDILKHAPLRFFAGFDFTRLRKYRWAQGFKLSGFICAVYLVLVSLYLVLADVWIDYHLSTSRADAEISLKNRRIISAYAVQTDSMRGTLDAMQPQWLAWDVLLDLQKEGVTFRAVNSDSKGVTFFITANKATAILDWLSRDERIDKATFTRAVRNVRGMEQTAILVSFRKDHSLNSAEDFVGQNAGDASEERVLMPRGQISEVGKGVNDG